MTHQNIDDRIKEALSADEARVLSDFAEEPSMLDQALQLLQTRNRMLTLIAGLFSIAFLIFGFYSLWNFFNVEETKDLIMWAMAFGFSIAAVCMMKIWAWMEIEKNATIREIKRLELQVAILTQRLDHSS